MKQLITFLLFLAFTSAALAHGDEDHGQGAAKSGHATHDAEPHIEAVTEGFELVGRFQPNELAIFVSRFETNEPVLDGKLEAELNGVKATAKFRQAQGDYVIDDRAFLQALAQPGTHAIVFTVAAANESDLLEGTLKVQPNAAAGNHSHFPWAWVGGGAAAVLVLAALAVRLHRSTSTKGK
jgi:hypothetical protein